MLETHPGACNRKEVKPIKDTNYNNKNPNPRLALDLNSPILRVKGMPGKDYLRFDFGSLMPLFGNRLEARIVEYLFDCLTLDDIYGFHPEGNKWIRQTVSEWVEILPECSRAKFDKAIASLIAKGVVERKILYDEKHSKYYKVNKTFSYRVNHERLEALFNEFMKNTGGAE